MRKCDTCYTNDEHHEIVCPKPKETEPFPESINVERALALSKIVHDRCDNVPHDIGLILEAEVQRLKPNETK